jgi:hypothetical protein
VIGFDDLRFGDRSVLPTFEPSSMISPLKHSKVILLTTLYAYTVAGSPRPRRPHPSSEASKAVILLEAERQMRGATSGTASAWRAEIHRPHRGVVGRSSTLYAWAIRNEYSVRK